MHSFFCRNAVVLLTVALSIVNANPILYTRQSPSGSLPFALQLNVTGTTLPQVDRARASAFLSKGQSLVQSKAAGNPNDGSAVSVGVTNTAVTYTAQVAVGNPPTTFTLLIDTGSSNTWVGASTPFQKSSTSKDTGLTVSVTYGSGSFSGEEVIDQVAIADNLVIKNQSIGVAKQAQGFNGVDGILGIGPVDLTVGTLSDKQQTVPTVTDNLFAQRSISSNSIGISFNPIANTNSIQNGELTFGGTDSSKFTGQINFSPITQTAPANQFWGIDQSITLGSPDGETILDTTAGIVDTGTTLILLATDAFQAYQKATGATLDKASGLLSISQEQFAKLPSLFFNVAGKSFELIPNAQIWPRSLNAVIGGDPNSILLVVSDLGSPSGQGLDFINGYTFLERFYSVFDTGSRAVGLATTPNTNAQTN